MFEKFGEFDSWEEINRAAAAQKAEGDYEAIKALAEENGLDPDDAQAYIDGEEEELTTRLLAMHGKLDIESKEYKVRGMLQDWVNIIKDAAINDEAFALGIRKKRKRLNEARAKCIDESIKNQFVVDKSISDRCCAEIKNLMGNHPLTMGDVTRKRIVEIARAYYVDNSEKPHISSVGQAVGGEA